MSAVDFATFCYAGDAHRLHAPGQLEKQVLSNGYEFGEVLVVYQKCNPGDYSPLSCPYPVRRVIIEDIDRVLLMAGIDVYKPQYSSTVDRHHGWKNHVANHLAAALASRADTIVFADSDCWIVRQESSWVERGIAILETRPEVFIVSPNDGEPERMTQVMSQQMLMARRADFLAADFSQPGYSGNPRDYPELPEYHAMLEGRMHYYCKATGRFRYVLGPEYRYFHHNRTNEDGSYKTNYADYGL